MKIIYFLFLTLLFSGCKRKTENTDSDLRNLYPLRETVKIQDFSEYIEDIQLVELEFTEQSMLDHVPKIIISKDGDYLIKQKENILKFNSEGKFDFKIGQIGRGSEEVLQLEDFCLSLCGNNILISDVRSKVIKYDLINGNYLETVYLKDVDDIQFWAIAPSIDNGFFLMSLYAGNPFDYEITYYCLKEFDSQGNLIEEHILRENFIFGTNSPFFTQSYNDNYFVKPISSENIFYKLSNGEVSKFLKIDFERKNLPQKYLMLVDIDENFSAESIFVNDYYKFPSEFHVAGDLCIFYVLEPSSFYTYYLYSLTENRGINWTPSSLFIASDEEYFYMVFDDYDEYSESEIKQIENPIKREVIKRTGVKLTESNQNPYLVKIKFKL